MRTKKFLSLLLPSLMVFICFFFLIQIEKRPTSCDDKCNSTSQCNKIYTSKGYAKEICKRDLHLFYICYCFTKFESQVDPFIASPPNY
ncbi:defensin-like protein 81 [Arabidopsis lyrata subsp. lyrata]|uniref:defensin-like protein 81 n=1 Tax=Arabidopsis lyrata subsp. lyrata TaxID=81972 RepID=UPI000A29C75E|nr:defensin-like protein 81 [Arabidopsis lyrata subsp. lyrata]|eukprot:XP_020868321.1 defensin-like protein 81 [Arabidopsis lyrata subsp. lyrata]